MELSTVDNSLAITIIQGDSYSFKMELYEDETNQIPVDLTGFNLVLRVSQSFKSPAIVTLREGAGLTVTQTTDLTTVEIDFSIQNTTPMKPGEYVYQLEYYDGLPDGSTRTFNRTFVNSTLTILEQVKA